MSSAAWPGDNMYEQQIKAMENAYQQQQAQLTAKQFIALHDKMLLQGGNPDLILASEKQKQEWLNIQYNQPWMLPVVATATAGVINASAWQWPMEPIAYPALKQSPNGGPRNAWTLDFVRDVDALEIWKDVLTAPAAVPSLGSEDWAVPATSPIWQASTGEQINWEKLAKLADTVSSASEKSGKDWKLIGSIPLAAIPKVTVASSPDTSTALKAEKKKSHAGPLWPFGKK